VADKAQTPKQPRRWGQQKNGSQRGMGAGCKPPASAIKAREKGFAARGSNKLFRAAKEVGQGADYVKRKGSAPVMGCGGKESVFERA